ncbi:MAG: cyclic nucleotide-binding domain-containing protein, partial [Pseudomonadota bacterium]
MTADLNQVIQILRREYLFEGLETDQIARVAKFFEQIEVEKGCLIFREGSPPDYFYLILEGQVRLTRRVRGKTQQINYLGPGDYLGEMSLLFRHPLSATAMAMGPATLLRLSPNRFHLLMKEYPQIRMNLSATAQSRKLVQKIHFDWLGPDEVIYYVTRKHVFFLIMKLFWPVLLLGIAAALV